MLVEPLEPRILFSGSPAPVEAPQEAEAEPAPEPAQVEQAAPQEAGGQSDQQQPQSQEVLDQEAADQQGEAAQVELDGEGEVAKVVAPLTDEQLQSVAEEAANRWRATGLTAQQEAALSNITYQVGELPGFVMGSQKDGVITLDNDASGVGWFVDETPWDDTEFSNILSGNSASTELAIGQSRMDLLTVVMHEQGHVLGLADVYDLGQKDNLMYGGAEVGVRRLPVAGQAEGATPGSVNGTAYAAVVAGQTADVVNGDVSSIANLIATNGGDGISLREAVLAANNTPGADQITLGAGTYNLTINGTDDNSGDLDIRDDLTITGAGAGSTIIDGGGSGGTLQDRVFEIHGGSIDNPGQISVSLNSVTITGGYHNTHGGGIANNYGNLNLDDTVVDGNEVTVSGRHGGGLWSRGWYGGWDEC